MIGVGIVTCGRPEYYKQVFKSVMECGGYDYLTIYEDGSDAFGYALTSDDGKNRGVAAAKNIVLSRMLDSGCDWLFVIEDDIILKREPYQHYIKACQASGYQHLAFHAHGSHNAQPLFRGSSVTLWPNYVGAFSVYSFQSLLTAGLLDEDFYNAWEHVEHTLRLAQLGFTAPWRGAADATGSEEYLEEIPGSIEGSVIRKDPHWSAKMQKGRDHWKFAHPDTYKLVFGG